MPGGSAEELEAARELVRAAGQGRSLVRSRRIAQGAGQDVIEIAPERGTGANAAAVVGVITINTMLVVRAPAIDSAKLR